MPSRTRAALATAAAIVVAGASVSTVAAATSASRGSRNAVTALPAFAVQITGAINAARAEHGLAPLHPSRPLRAAAVFHSYDMARHGFFSHDSSNGTSASARLSRFYPSVGFRSWDIGETLLEFTGGMDARSAVRDWLASPEHRAILLDGTYREIGVSAVHTTASSGAFGGRATLVTADLGARAR